MNNQSSSSSQTVTTLPFIAIDGRASAGYSLCATPMIAPLIGVNGSASNLIPTQGIAGMQTVYDPSVLSKSSVKAQQPSIGQSYSVLIPSEYGASAILLDHSGGRSESTSVSSTSSSNKRSRVSSPANPVSTLLWILSFTA